MDSNPFSTLPRDFKYTYTDEPKTPESAPVDEPLMPRPARLRLKRRNISSFHAPTEQFLASVASADTPLPTIEIADIEMFDNTPQPITQGLLSVHSHNRGHSPPKTPLPEVPEADRTVQFPDWSRDTPSPVPEAFERPTSSRSTASDCSEDSFYSTSHLSRPSESTCTSPEAELADPFLSPCSSKGKGRNMREPLRMNGDVTNFITDKVLLSQSLRSKLRPDVGWTKAQTTHLWSTYMQYLQDPTLTPFRFGSTCVPPEGVVHRVARQAKRSWKGPQSTNTSFTFPPVRDELGRATERLDMTSYGVWPHSKCATRNHLKELCKLRSTTAVHCHRHRQSRSTTPFTKLSKYDADSGPFATNDISLSLTTSVSETMHPDGPLAQLALDSPPLRTGAIVSDPLQSAFNVEQEPLPYRSLASPWAQTYGPSTSKHLSASNGTNSPPLRSPITFSHSRSLSNTQKRAAQYDLEADLSTGNVRRPSILNDQLFGTQAERRRVRSRGFSLGDELLRARANDTVWNPLAELSRAQPESSMSSASSNSMSPAALSERFGPPPRLRSPFELGASNNTFPRVHFQDKNNTARKAPYATHRSRRSIESFDFGPSLRSRLSQLDTGLNDIREREEIPKE